MISHNFYLVLTLLGFVTTLVVYYWKTDRTILLSYLTLAAIGDAILWVAGENSFNFILNFGTTLKASFVFSPQVKYLSLGLDLLLVVGFIDRKNSFETRGQALLLSLVTFTKLFLYSTDILLSVALWELISFNLLMLITFFDKEKDYKTPLFRFTIGSIFSLSIVLMLLVMWPSATSNIDVPLAFDVNALQTMLLNTPLAKAFPLLLLLLAYYKNPFIFAFVRIKELFLQSHSIAMGLLITGVPSFFFMKTFVQPLIADWLGKNMHLFSGAVGCASALMLLMAYISKKQIVRIFYTFCTINLIMLSTTLIKENDLSSICNDYYLVLICALSAAWIVWRKYYPGVQNGNREFPHFFSSLVCFSTSLFLIFTIIGFPISSNGGNMFYIITTLAAINIKYAIFVLIIAFLSLLIIVRGDKRNAELEMPVEQSVVPAILLLLLVGFFPILGKFIWMVK